MFILQIEHPVPDYNGWKKAFDSDPLNRRQSGVRRHSVLRPVNTPNQVIIELEFGSLEKAQAMLEALQKLWNRVEGTVMMNPQARILETAEHIEY